MDSRSKMHSIKSEGFNGVYYSKRWWKSSFVFRFRCPVALACSTRRLNGTVLWLLLSDQLLPAQRPWELSKGITLYNLSPPMQRLYMYEICLRWYIKNIHNQLRLLHKMIYALILGYRYMHVCQGGCVFGLEWFFCGLRTLIRIPNLCFLIHVWLTAS